VRHPYIKKRVAHFRPEDDKEDGRGKRRGRVQESSSSMSENRNPKEGIRKQGEQTLSSCTKLKKRHVPVAARGREIKYWKEDRLQGPAAFSGTTSPEKKETGRGVTGPLTKEQSHK